MLRNLDYLILSNQLDKVIKRAELNNVKLFLTICTTLESFEKIKLIINQYKNIYGTFGIHPHETINNTSINSNYIVGEDIAGISGATISAESITSSLKILSSNMLYWKSLSII